MNDLLKIYKKDINKPKKMDRYYEDNLFKLYQSDKININLKNNIFEYYLQNIIIIGHTFRNYNEIALIDLIQVGNILLWELIDEYDYKQETSFPTFLTKCVKREMLKYIRLTKNTVYLPLRYQRELKAKGEILPKSISINQNEDDEDKEDIILLIEADEYEFDTKIEDSFEIIKKILEDDYTNFIIEFEKTNRIPIKYKKKLALNKKLQKLFREL